MEEWQPRSSANWPRTTDLSHHSPNFFAQNKDRFLRQMLIRDIQALAKRPLVVYFASSSFQAHFRNEDVKRLYEVVHSFSDMDVDLFLETKGGETDATEAIVSCIKKICRSFRVIVPGRAKSNGTLICLAADSLVMGATSELGPIEPLVDYIPASILLSDQYRENARHYDPTLAKLAEYATQHSLALAKKYLDTGLMRGKGREEIDDTAKKLCGRQTYSSHGSVVDAAEARALGMNIEVLDTKSPLWRMSILLHSFYTFDSHFRGVGKFFEQEVFSSQVLGDDPPIIVNGG